MDINQLCNSINTDEENDWPNQIPIIPIKGFLIFCGIFTSAPHKAKIAIKKAGPKTHGNGNNSILKTDPPSIPINIVLRIILVFFINNNYLLNQYNQVISKFHYTLIVVVSNKLIYLFLV